jgi:hypothetical protein
MIGVSSGIAATIGAMSPSLPVLTQMFGAALGKLETLICVAEALRHRYLR